MIRHGQRADLHPEKEIVYDVPHDPPLTDEGFQQARETGEFLKEYIKRHQFDDIILETSPFLRTMQTAHEIAKILQLKHLTIDYLYREWLDGTFFRHNPLEDINIRLWSQDELKTNVLSEIDDFTVLDIPDNINDLYPENKQQSKQRTQSVIDLMKTRYAKEQEKRVLHMIVSHGYHVECFSTLNGGKQTYPEYCSISGFELIKGSDDHQIQLLFDGDSSHVKTKH
eukprot:403349935